MSGRNSTMSAESRFQASATKQYERCMVDSSEMIAYKKQPDLTIDEMAELRCKPFACKIQLCMSLPKREKPFHKDVYTGELYALNDPCINAHTDFVDCVNKEKQNILDN